MATTRLTPADIVVAGDLRATDINGRKFIQWSTSHNVFVQAGAGSGKTTTLIQRMLTLLIDDGVTVDQLAAITFTEAAAGKLVADLRAALTEVAHLGTHTPFAGGTTTVFDVGPDEAKLRAAKALEGLPGAAIGTLHSFCLRLLKQFPLEAGLPPKVDKVDELRQQMDASLRVDAVMDTLTRLVDAEPGAVAEIESLKEEFNLDIDPEKLTGDLQLLLSNDAKMSTLGEQARWMDERWGELDETLAAPRWEPETVEDFLAGQLKLLTSLRDAYLTAGGDPSDKLLAQVSDRIDMIRPYTQEKANEAETWFPEFKSPGNSGSGREWDKAILPGPIYAFLEEFAKFHDAETANLKVAREVLKSSAAAFDARTQIALQQALDHITPVIAGLVLHEKDARVRRGTLEYHDMIFLARQLVTAPENDEIRRLLHQQYQVIFVDEFQDTDPVQYDIVRAIAAGSMDGRPVPGSLFMVGDPKQSIYRFRNADIDNYNAVKSTYGEAQDSDGVLVNLSQNFRSSDKVIGAVNTIFAEVFGEEEPRPNSPTQAAYDEMLSQGISRAERPDGSEIDLPGKVVFLYSDESAGGSSAERKYCEEDDIVALIRAATENDDPTFYHHKPVEKLDAAGKPITGTAVTRTLKYSDIAVLVPTHNDSRRILRALSRANIPYVSEGSTRLFLVPEINDLLTVLRAIGDPADSFAQIAALRTAALGVSDADLAAEAKGETVAAVEEARKILKEFTDAAGAKDVGTVVRELVEKLELADAYVATHRADALGSLEQAVALAEKFGRVTGMGVREFVRWADEQSEGNNGASDPVLANQAEGVRVMTVHKSKGLEFPMVIAAGLSNDYKTPTFTRGLARETPRVAHLKLGMAESPGFTALREFEAAADKDEMKRLLYVALTRAESVLAVPLHIAETGTSKDNREKARAKAAKKGTTPEEPQREFYKRKGLPLMEALDQLAARTGEDGLAALQEAGLVLTERDSLGAPTTPLPLQTMQAEVRGNYSRTYETSQGEIGRANAHSPRVGVTAIAHAKDQKPAERQPEAPAAATPLATRHTGAAVHDTLRAKEWAPAGSFRDVNAQVERKTTGTEFGSAVHEVMERIADAGDATTTELAEIAARLYELEPSAVPEIAAAADAFAASTPYLASIDGRKVHRELPIVGVINEVQIRTAEQPEKASNQDIAVNGYIDLLYQDGDEWVVADYKTDVYARSERVESYFMQLELYARILQSSLGTKVSRLELIFLDGSRGELGTQVITHQR